MIYIAGSLRNPKVIDLTLRLRDRGFHVFSEWMAAGKQADEEWEAYFKALGYSYRDALKSDFVQTAFNFDKDHIDKAHTFIAIAPFGKSAGIELGYAVKGGKRSYVLLEEEPARYDLMLAFATDICYDIEELVDRLRRDEMVRRA